MSESKGCGEFITPHERCEEGFLCVKCKNVGFMLSEDEVDVLLDALYELDECQTLKSRELILQDKLLEFVNK